MPMPFRRWPGGSKSFPPISRSCHMGAKPEKARFHNTFILRLGAAPPVPLPEATAEALQVVKYS